MWPCEPNFSHLDTPSERHVFETFMLVCGRWPADQQLICTSLFFFSWGPSRHHSVEPESVLLGHEAWAVSLHWSPILFEDDLPKLASASADRSLIIWSYSPATSLWLNEYRLGELGGPAGLGFFGALWGKQCQSIMVHDWSGSLHIWRRAPSANVWSAGVGLSGHFKETMDIEWQAQGKWLLSARYGFLTNFRSRHVNVKGCAELCCGVLPVLTRRRDCTHHGSDKTHPPTSSSRHGMNSPDLRFTATIFTPSPSQTKIRVCASPRALTKPSYASLTPPRRLLG